MGDWLLMPAKVFLIGLFLAIIATFSFRSVEIPYVQQAAIVSAQTASTSSTPQATATSTVDSMTHSSANDMLTIGNNGMVTSTVSYQPPNVFSNVFNYLGVPTPNQPIVMSSSAVAKNTGIQMQSVMPNLQLYTVSGAPTVANVVSGYEEEIVGTLAFAGTPIANADITLTTSGGTIGEATANPTNGTTTTIDGASITLTAPSTSEVTSGIPSTTTLNLKTNAEGQFALDYYAPINIGQFSVTTNGANATETVPISSTPVVTVGNIANTYVNGSTTISGNVQTSSGSPVQNDPVTLTITAPDTTTQQVNTITDSSGNFSTIYTPVQLGGYMVKAECEGGTSNLYEQAVNLNQNNVNAEVTFPSQYLYQTINGSVLDWAEVESGTTTPIGAGEYGQFSYNAPSGYDINQFVSTWGSDFSSGGSSTTPVYVYFAENGTQTSVFDPITYTSGSLPLSFTTSSPSNTLVGGWGSDNQYNPPFAIGGGFYYSTVFISPSGSSSSGGIFGVSEPEVTIVSGSGATLNSPSTVTFNVSYNGKGIQDIPITMTVQYSPGFNSWTGIPFLNSSGASVSSLSGTTDSNGNMTFNFTVPTSSTYSAPVTILAMGYTTGYGGASDGWVGQFN